jgi:hypothetical protein
VPQELLFCAVSGTQTPLAQQPLGHEAASQTHSPFLHSCPMGQLTHAAPLAPQAVEVSLVTGTQPELLQQPLHELASQTHPPFLHS